MTVCALCEKPRALRESHIVPGFVFDYIKETSATGYLRRTVTPNKREQDGPKLPLLCDECEGRFGKLEKWFAEEVFRPFIADQSARLPFDERLLLFASSLAWRCIRYYAYFEPMGQLVPEHGAMVARAELSWRRYLLGEVPHPGHHEQHLVPFSALSSTDNPNLAPNFNRYMLRAVDMDLPSARGSALTYVKLPFFAFFGTITSSLPRNRWQNTRVPLRGGTIAPAHFVIPGGVGEYINGQVHKAAAALKAISPKQQEKINAAMTSDLDRLAQSESFQAMRHDVAVFGRAAFLRASEYDSAPSDSQAQPAREEP